MELYRADPDTQHEVDLLIFDYLLCTSIYGLIYASRLETQQQPDEHDLNWHADTVHTLKSALQLSGFFSDDILVKVQLLEFAKVFRSYPGACLALQPHGSQLATGNACLEAKSTPLPELAVAFISLCRTVGTKLSGARWTDTAALFFMQAAVEEYRTSESSDGLSKRIAWAEEILGQAANTNPASRRYMSHLRPPVGTPLNIHLDTVSAKFPLPQFRSAVLDVLLDIMKVLESPVLIQLERGKLGGLSRAETRQLKDRVGLK